MLSAAAIFIVSPPWAARCVAQEAPATVTSAAASRAASEDASSRSVRPRGEAESRKVGQSRTSDGAMGWLRTLGAMAIVVGLIFAARWALKRWSPAKAAAKKSGPITVIAETSVGPRQQILLVRMGRRLVLVGNGPAGMSPLAEVTNADEVAELMDEIATKK